MYIDGVETARVETSKNIGQIVSQLEGHLRIKTQILEWLSQLQVNMMMF